MTQIDQYRLFIALGSNLGDRAESLARARRLLAPQIEIGHISDIYETLPWGFARQPPFLNQVIEAHTRLTAEEALQFLKEIEAGFGERPELDNGPRRLDLDLLSYDELVLDTDKLQLPHPRLAERAFVLVPWAEIAPDYLVPGLEKRVGQLLLQVETDGVWRWRAPQPPAAAGDLRLRDTHFVWGSRTYIMGILNLTPDSFSGDGLLGEQQGVEAALSQADRFIDAGADVLDLGGQSTRPGSEPISAQEEAARVLPALEALRSRTDLPLSIDTYFASVAAAALQAGADWVNDVWGLRADPDLAGVAADHSAPVILMHNRMTPNSADVAERLGGRYVGVEYDDLLADIQLELLRSVELAIEAGIPEAHIMLDPGLGFGKTVDQNLELLNRTHEIRALGFPVLLGPSRKSFIGYTLDLPPDQRLYGTGAAAAVGILRGADMLRVHDVGAMVQVARMTDAIVRPADHFPT